jgi:hypothetical protein
MGNEQLTTVDHLGKTQRGKALLESNEIIFRADGLRLKIPFASIKSATAANGQLKIKTADGESIFHLGDKAGKWRDKITNPKSLIDKLGPMPNDEVVVQGKFPPDFSRDLKKQEVKLATKISSTTKWIFLAVETQSDLTKIKSTVKSMSGATALWLIYPKGQKSLTEHDVRAAGLKSNLTDIKVASFSPTHTALKFVIPTSKR